MNKTSVAATAVSSSSPSALFAAQVQIPLYSVIFLLAVTGNVLVILTLVQNKRMRTVTNVHLLNLAISDLLLGVFCMPFTLVGMLLRDFVFGDVMCKLIPYLQAVSVAVSAWTLVAISVERYYAICHPFMSRRWQTLSHAHHIIVIIWVGSSVCMTPIALLSLLQPLGETGRSKCREEWPSDASEKAFNIFLDAILLVIPLLIMVITYSLITATLWKGIKTEEMNLETDEVRENSTERDSSNKYNNGNTTTRSRTPSEETLALSSARSQVTTASDETTTMMTSRSRAVNYSPPSFSVQVRRSNVEVSLANKKRVIKMLFVVVLEFFICWTPLYIINTMALFCPRLVYQDLGYMNISFFQLIAYASSCCNPITYCFMNSKFKHAFLSAFGCDRFFPSLSSSSDVTHKHNKTNTSSCNYAVEMTERK